MAHAQYLGLGQLRSDHSPGQALAAVIRQYENIGQLRESGAIRDEARKSHLGVAGKHADAKRMCDGANQDLFRNARRPVRFCQKTMDDIEIETRAIEAQIVRQGCALRWAAHAAHRG